MGRLKIHSHRSKFWKGHRAGRGPRSIAAKVQVYRNPRQKGVTPFYACVSIKGRKMRQHLTFRVTPGAKHEAANRACGAGRNPRIAVGRAFAKLGRLLAHRTGAFRGL